MTTGSSCAPGVGPTYYYYCDENPIVGARVTDGANYNWSQSSTSDGATSLDDGKANSALIFQNDSNSPIVNHCNDTRVSVYTDWFIPGQQELIDVVYANRVALGGFDSAAGYWSSTEDSANNAIIVDFNTGASSSVSKQSYKHSRCVRRY
jgi:hypothetical protein